MPRLTRVWPVLAAGATTGLAIWFTRASLDLFAGPAGATRVAMVPSWWELAVLVLFASALFAGAAMMLWRRRDSTLDDDAAAREIADCFIPFFALALLGLPYVPLVPDWLPIFLILAGHGKYLVWIVVSMQTAWALFDRAPRARSFGGPRIGTALVLVAAFLVIGTTAWRLTGSGPFPGGDEPHYLIIAQSLWRDHDLKIENNHARRDYEEYFHAALPPHYQARGSNGAIYSIHPIGLPVLLAPVYALDGYPAVVTFLTAVGALTTALMWRWVRALTASPIAATFAAAAVGLSAPFLLGSVVVYPEMSAACCVMMAFLAAAPDAGLGRWTVAAIAVSALPWLSTKYAPMALALTAVCLFRAWRDGRQSWRLRAVVMLATFGVSLTGWLAFFAAIWGSPLPSAPYGGIGQMQFQYLAKGAPGLLFDQEYGVIAYAPVLLLGFTGLWTMWRRGGFERRTAVEIVAVFVPLWLTVSAYELWWGGSSTPGRPLVAGLPLLAAPVAWQHLGSASSARRAAHGVLLSITLWITGTLVFAQKGLLIAAGHVGVSPLLGWLSPNWRLWALAPSAFAYSLALFAAFSAVWLIVALGSRAVLDIQPKRLSGTAGFVATTTAMSALALVSVILPTAFGSRLQRDVSLEARARIDMLDDFDRTVRPTAFVYDPFRRFAVTDVPSLFVFAAAPGQRPGRQPLDLLFNARFALAAGRYTVEIAADRESRASAGNVSLQVGRGSGPVVRWDLQLDPGGTWRTEFRLPIDAGFVGFVGSPAVRDAASSIRVRAIDIVDEHERLRTLPEVLGAAVYGTTSVYADEDTWLEPTGFWTRGGATVSIVLAPQQPGGLSLRLRSVRQNSVVLESGSWRRLLELPPGLLRDVHLPESGRADRLVALRVTSASGFTPAAEEPRNPDQRFLGCWVEIAGN